MRCLLSSLIVVLLGWTLAAKAAEAPQAAQGILDLRQWNFEDEGPVTLRGDWGFHWQQLLRPDEPGFTLPPPAEYRKIPGFWNRPDDQGKAWPVHGFATWHLRILLPKGTPSWALDIGNFFTSAEVYANGRLIFQAGKVGTSDATSEHSMKSGLAWVENPGETLDLVIPMANFVHGKAGFGRMRFAPTPIMITEREHRLGIYYWILGTIAIMGVYHLGLFLLRREEKSTLYFALSCAINGSFTLITSGIIWSFFPQMHHELWWKIFYVSWYLGYPAFSLFARSLFPKEFARGFVTISNILGIGGVLWALALPFQLADKSAPVFQIFGLFHFSYMVYAAVKAHRNGRPHALIFIAGTSLYFVMIMHDVIAAEGLIDAPLRSSYGLVTFFLFQSFLLAARFSKAFFDLEIKEREIMALNNGLEHMVDEKTRDIRSILRSIQQGIFMIRKTPDQKLETHPDYSHFLTSMLKTTPGQGQDPLDLMFQKAEMNDEQKAMTRSVVEASLGESVLAFEMNSSHLPQEFAVRSEADRREVWEVDWTPVLNAENSVDRILVSLRDVTRMRQLQDEAIEQQKELEYISEIVNVSAANFDKFIRMSRAFLDENRRLIQANSRLSSEIVKILFINMHTIKGNARGYSFRKMSGILHSVEQQYAELLNSGGLTWDQASLLHDLDDVQAMIDRYDHINQVKLGRRSQEKHVMMERQVVAEQIDSLNLVDTSSLTDKDRGIIEDTKMTFKSVFFSRSIDVLEDILGESERLARDLKKDKPIIVIDDPGFSLTQEAQELFHNIFTHIIRNSLDHGIESPQERVQKGKRPSGTLELRLHLQQGRLVLDYRDDGRGLNLRYLRELGLKKGLLSAEAPLTPEMIADLVFVGGLSTSAELTEISGRGVGMDAVKRYVENMGGVIRIRLDERIKGRLEYCPFSLEISIPDRYFSRSPAGMRRAS